MWPKRLWNASMVGLVVKKRQGRVSASDLNAGLWKQERKKKLRELEEKRLREMTAFI